MNNRTHVPYSTSITRRRHPEDIYFQSQYRYLVIDSRTDTIYRWINSNEKLDQLQALCLALDDEDFKDLACFNVYMIEQVFNDD